MNAFSITRRGDTELAGGALMLRNLFLAALLAFSSLTQGQLVTLGSLPTSGVSCSDSDWSNVSLLALNENGADGTSTFIDQSDNARTITVSSVTWSNTTAPTGLTTSGKWTGSGSQYLRVPSADYLGAGDFTLEYYYNRSAGANPFGVDHRGTGGLYSHYNGANWQFQFNSGTSLTPSFIGSSAWHHFAVVRSSGTIKVYTDGTQTGGSTSESTAGGTALMYIGFDGMGSASNPWNGYLAAFRVTKAARWTGNFTPPSLPLPNC